MKFKIIILFFLLSFLQCKKKTVDDRILLESNDVVCNEAGCKGFYEGPEFINNEDIAHQFSNKMSAKVGEQLKTLYQAKIYSKVDFDHIKMTTAGMNSGQVKYELFIPFVQVESKCDAFTSFDHVGGWNHKPALEERKLQLQKVLIEGDSLNISSLKTTPENLQEYWIQWRNRDFQSDCF